MSLLALSVYVPPFYLWFSCFIAAALPPVFLHYSRIHWRIPLWHLLCWVSVLAVEGALVKGDVESHMWIAQGWGPHNWTAADQLLSMITDPRDWFLVSVVLVFSSVTTMRLSQRTRTNWSSGDGFGP